MVAAISAAELSRCTKRGWLWVGRRLCRCLELREEHRHVQRRCAPAPPCHGGRDGRYVMLPPTFTNRPARRRRRPERTPRRRRKNPSSTLGSAFCQKNGLGSAFCQPAPVSVAPFATCALVSVVGISDLRGRHQVHLHCGRHLSASSVTLPRGSCALVPVARMMSALPPAFRRLPSFDLRVCVPRECLQTR